MRMWVYIAALLLPAVPAGADIVSCLHSASTTTVSCRGLSQKAKSDADQVSSQYSKLVEGKSVKQTSDLMVESTKKINGIYQSAEDTCNNLISQCVGACSGEGAELATACQQQMGKYVAQVSGGHDESQRGKDGGTASSTQAKTMADTGTVAKELAGTGNTKTAKVDEEKDQALAKAKIADAGPGTGAGTSEINASGGSSNFSVGSLAIPAGGDSNFDAGAEDAGVSQDEARNISHSGGNSKSTSVNSESYSGAGGSGAGSSGQGAQRESLHDYLTAQNLATKSAARSGRSPASVASESVVSDNGVGTPMGPSLFQIHAKVYQGMCWDLRLSCR